MKMLCNRKGFGWVLWLLIILAAIYLSIGLLLSLYVGFKTGFWSMEVLFKWPYILWIIGNPPQTY
ncbi:hypothetical protein D1BOALGB6SA_4980 [Olavius sp. associated proteobacterium Delta 1]|nr:hypothetical protein D1BOALGB6SA_4980 [Olavius sp. associated proteobacterium Delta 1]